MGQRLQPWRSTGSEKGWLSMLIGAMDDASRPESRASACDPAMLVAFAAQLARPASPYPPGASKFSLRN